MCFNIGFPRETLTHFRFLLILLLDKPGPTPLLTECDIHHGLESCAKPSVEVKKIVDIRF